MQTRILAPATLVASSLAAYLLRLSAVALLSFPFLLISCGDGGSATGPKATSVASVQVSPSTGSVDVGQTLSLAATAKDAAGNMLTGRTITWSSTDGSATVSGAGLVTGVDVGAATITATCEGKSGTAAITVTPDLGTVFGADQFAQIPAGTFQMGDIIGNGWPHERPVHTVNITQPFSMLKTEVTQGQWRAVLGNDPSDFDSCGDTCPVENVNWHDVLHFLSTLNARDPGKNYRLPTEAEWEYAARAGTTGDYAGTGVLDDMGWYADNSGSATHPAAEKQPNAWGLYDMHGNVWEWVQDWYASGYYGVSPTDDPPGPPTGMHPVSRGGSWRHAIKVTRCAARSSIPPHMRYADYGFRLRAPRAAGPQRG